MEITTRNGQLIAGKYILGNLIGVGSMGVVYSAVSESFGRRVAIKMPRPDAVPESTVHRRFRTEAFVASRLRHPNIVAVIDHWNGNGVPYLAMEHVKGTLLGRIVAERGPLDVSTVIDIGSQLLDALHESHVRGIVHADVNSSNVLLERRQDGIPMPRLFDFGLARTGTTKLERENDIICGTPHYMAPEVVRGYPASPASDLYSVGVLLYELLTGVTPFAGGGISDVLNRQLHEDAVLPSRRRNDGEIPDRVDALVMRALAKCPVARFSDAMAFASELRALTTVSAPRRCVPAVSSSIHVDINSVVGDVTPCPVDGTRVAELRRGVSQAVATGDAATTIVAYMELVSGLLDEHAPSVAAAELEHAVEQLTRESDAGRPAASMWCVLLMLATLYEHLDDLSRARKLACAAHDRAARVCSPIGQECSTALLSRLVPRQWRPKGAAVGS